ncbi:2OG-Fe(II) oxygenase [Cupriavidus necator]|uniref:2OG-Fe(II) oxygenase n=1 Tax=Cupriavidus necator TaxID=106590 RepID=A0A1U9US89_CUPNE|nr:2OG-Fe(II) oxygenase [Cupriavidus necator]AQV95287.1 2OG-Fe(II) oxygenase [Cupriavidus necator]
MTKEQLIALMLSRLEKEQESIVSQWANPEGTHTRHFYVDDLLPREIAHSIYDAFPRDADGFFNRESFREKKRTLTNLQNCAPILSDITYAFQDQAVIEKIGSLVSFTALDPDPSLYAAGLSMMFKEDFLNPHIDNSHDGERQKYRRLNLLYYVSPDWSLENGGNFELWDTDVKKQKTVVAKFNRLLVMETNATSWHSVSPVIVDVPRCCVSNYLFSTQSPSGKDYFHVTSFLGRPDQTGKRIVGRIDNSLRNLASKALNTGRGRDLLNTDHSKK